MQKNINNLLIPNVSKLPSQRKVDVSNKLGKGNNSEEFKNLLDHNLNGVPENLGVKLSNHAAKRINERSLQMDSNEFMKLREGIDKLREKGGKESLVITPNAAYIVDVEKDTVVTAIDKDGMAENVFTKIDSTVFMN